VGGLTSGGSGGGWTEHKVALPMTILVVVEHVCGVLHCLHAFMWGPFIYIDYKYNQSRKALRLLLAYDMS